MSLSSGILSSRRVALTESSHVLLITPIIGEVSRLVPLGRALEVKDSEGCFLQWRRGRDELIRASRGLPAAPQSAHVGLNTGNEGASREILTREAATSCFPISQVSRT